MIFRNKNPRRETASLILFNSAEEAVGAQFILKKAGLEARLKAAPPHLRKGCDLALEIEPLDKTVIDGIFEAGDIEYVAFIAEIQAKAAS